MSDVRYPSMRGYVQNALEALADLDYQKRVWGNYAPDIDRYDDLDLNIHILYDDCVVLPDPELAVGTVLLQSDVASLKDLEAELGSILDRLDDAPTAVYLADPAWLDVVGAAGRALAAFRANP